MVHHSSYYQTPNRFTCIAKYPVDASSAIFALVVLAVVNYFAAIGTAKIRGYVTHTDKMVTNFWYAVIPVNIIFADATVFTEVFSKIVLTSVSINFRFAKFVAPAVGTGTCVDVVRIDGKRGAIPAGVVNLVTELATVRGDGSLG